MMPPEIQILISIHKDQTALIYTLWSVFQGLSFVLIGYVFSQEYVRKSPLILFCFSASTLLFSIGNHNAIMRAQALVEAAAKQLNLLAASSPGLQGVLNAFQAPPTQQLAWAHIVFAVFVAAGIWVPFVAFRFSERLSRTR
ncbi:hypothetical protein LP416_13310 [Polaromonas sp. P2-4]|nr:hypothetical protein LP416_13310 [Polaromonas sp. P2-4]